MPSFSLHTMLATILVLFLMATPSLGGVLCSKTNTADSKQTVVAQLEENATGDELTFCCTKLTVWGARKICFVSNYSY